MNETISKFSNISAAERLRRDFEPSGNIEETVEKLTQELYEQIQSLPDTLEQGNTTWYVSGSGRKGASGNSAEDPFCSLDELEANRERIHSGDTVLFARGEEFRGCCVTSVSGVKYGAYGEGAKPIINSSLRNHITDEWRHVGDGVWTSDGVYPADVGNVIIDEGVHVGFKRLHREDVKEIFDFWSDHDDGNRIYIKLSDDPRKLFTSIEIAFNIWMFRLENNTDITVENLAFRYGGGHAIRGAGCNNITVRGCDFRFIGGAYLTEYKDGTVRCGNCVEFMCGCKNITVEYCCMDQVYDSGITHQGCGNYVAENITFRNNLIERCGMGGIEYWLGQGSLARNVAYEGNVMRYAGECFGGIQRPDKYATAHIHGNGYLHNRIEEFVIKDNIFFGSRYDLIDSQSRENTLPKLIGNVYIQQKGSRIGSWGEFKDVTTDNTEGLMLNWQDSTGQVYII